VKLQFFLFGLSLLPSALHADAPLPPPEDYTVKSRNGRFEARVSVSPAETRVYQIGSPDKLLWRKPGFHRHVYLSDDGRHLVAAYDGHNLIPLNYSPDLVLITFFDRSSPIRRVTLSEILPDLSRLRRTMSHYSWGSFGTLDESGHFVVTTVDNRVLRFDLATGKKASAERRK
jgi:hypothetical protein